MRSVWKRLRAGFFEKQSPVVGGLFRRARESTKHRELRRGDGDTPYPSKK